MTFSVEWEQQFAAGYQKTGWSAEFQTLMRNFVAESDKTLELGPGPGANIDFFLNMPTDYYGIEGSASAVANLHKARPYLKDRIFHGDFTKSLPDDGFDLICERASLPHNDLASIYEAVDLIFHALKPGGLFISSDWFSSKHSEFGRGTDLGQGTRSGYEDGQFAGIGKVHFSDEQELTDLFTRFDRLVITERTNRRPAPALFLERPVDRQWISSEYRRKEYVSAVWDLIVRKPL